FAVWGWRLNLVLLPHLLVEEYERLKALAVANLLEVISRFGIVIPRWLIDVFSNWIADFLILYFLLALSIVRGSSINRRIDRIQLKANPQRFRENLAAAAVLHGHRTASDLISAVEAGLEKGWKAWFRFQKRIWSSAIRWPVTLKRNWMQMRTGV